MESESAVGNLERSESEILERSESELNILPPILQPWGVGVRMLYNVKSLF